MVPTEEDGTMSADDPNQHAETLERMAAEEKELHERSKLGELEDGAKRRLADLRWSLDHAHRVLKEREANDQGTVSIDEARTHMGEVTPIYEE